MFGIITANDHKLTLPAERKAFDDAETARITSNRCTQPGPEQAMEREKNKRASDKGNSEYGIA
jgi:hypothetical protein